MVSTIGCDDAKRLRSVYEYFVCLCGLHFLLPLEGKAAEDACFQHLGARNTLIEALMPDVLGRYLRSGRSGRYRFGTDFHPKVRTYHMHSV